MATDLLPEPASLILVTMARMLPAKCVDRGKTHFLQLHRALLQAIVADVGYALT